MKFEELAIQFEAYKKNFIKKSAMSVYVNCIASHLVPAFGELEEISEHQVQDFILSKISSGMSHNYVRDCIMVLKQILKWGKSRAIYPYKEFENIKYPVDHSVKKIKTYTLAETKKLINYLKDNLTFRNLGILIAASSGMRVGEVCALQWGDIDLQAGIITIQRNIQRIYHQRESRTEIIIDTPKTKSSQRQVPISPDLMKIFKALKSIAKDDHYVVTNSAKPEEPRTHRSYIEDLVKIIDIPYYGYHVLRHTFATRCIEAEIDVKTVSVMLGHSDVSITLNTYVHPSDAQKKTAINKLFKTLG